MAEIIKQLSNSSHTIEEGELIFVPAGTQLLEVIGKHETVHTVLSVPEYDLGRQDRDIRLAKPGDEIVTANYIPPRHVHSRCGK